MARTEEDKEDLIRDATAMVQRAELTLSESDQLITIGFFRDDRCAVYFNQDPFYQFDAVGRLRRAFEAGYLYRSQGTTLARIDRRRNSTRVTLQRVDLDSNELQEFCNRMKARLTQLRDQIGAGRFSVQRAVTTGGGIPAETLPMLERVLDRDTRILAPTVGAR